MLLRERGKIRLDDRLGQYLANLTPEFPTSLFRSCFRMPRPDSGEFSDRRPFLSEAEFRADLSAPQPLAPGVTMRPN